VPLLQGSVFCWLTHNTQPRRSILQRPESSQVTTKPLQSSGDRSPLRTPNPILTFPQQPAPLKSQSPWHSPRDGKSALAITAWLRYLHFPLQQDLPSPNPARCWEHSLPREPGNASAEGLGQTDNCPWRQAAYTVIYIVPESNSLEPK